VGLVIEMPEGATEADIQGALAALPDGATLRLAANQTIAIAKGLTIDISSRAITFDLNGSTLQQAANVPLVTMVGSHAKPQAATVGVIDGKAAVTFAANPGLREGDWIKIFSDDAIPHDQGDLTRMGQSARVVAVNGNTVILEGTLLDGERYQTNVRAAAFISAAGRITNGTFSGDRSHDDWRQSLVQVGTAINPVIDHITVRDNNEGGFKIVDCVQAQVNQCASFNLRDDDTAGFWGKAVQSASSLGTSVTGLFADHVRHATDSQSGGCVAGDPNPARYGADIGMTVSDVVVNAATATAFSWHSEGRLSDIHDSVVFNSWGVVGARGVGNSVHDVSAAYNLRGIQFFEYGDGDGRDITISRVQMTNLTYYAWTSVGKTANNLVQDSAFEVAQRIAWPSMGISALNAGITYAAGIGKTMTGTSGIDRLLGTIGTDRISAGAANDYIWGGTGADVLSGGAGHDRFAYHAFAEAGDTITDFNTSDDGDIIDVSVLALMNGWIGDPVASCMIRVRQAGQDSIVEARKGTDYVVLATLTGTDAALVTSHVSRTIAVTGAATLLDLAGASNASGTGSQSALIARIGTAACDRITATDKSGSLVEAGAGDDTITLGGGDDSIRGGSGNDAIAAGDGNDTIRFSGGGEGFDRIDGGAGRDRIVAMTDGTKISVTALTNVELVTADGHRGVIIQGSWLDDTVNLSGATLDGIDSIQLGSGNDSFIGSNSGELINGSWGNDTLSGMGGDDIFVIGKAEGNDTIVGGSGFDTIRVANAGAVLNWAQISSIEALDLAPGATLALSGTAANDLIDLSDMRMNGGVRLNGGNGNDTLLGGQWNDVLSGGNGEDTLTGGAGEDSFRFAYVWESRPGSGIDVIKDFTHGVDSIDLSAIDANSRLAGQQHFTFIGDAAYTKAAGQLHLEAANGGLTLAGDINGDGRTDFAIALTPGTQIGASDLVL